MQWMQWMKEALFYSFTLTLLPLFTPLRSSAEGWTLMSWHFSHVKSSGMSSKECKGSNPKRISRSWPTANPNRANMPKDIKDTSAAPPDYLGSQIQAVIQGIQGWRPLPLPPTCSTSGTSCVSNLSALYRCYSMRVVGVLSMCSRQQSRESRGREMLCDWPHVCLVPQCALDSRTCWPMEHFMCQPGKEKDNSATNPSSITGYRHRVMGGPYLSLLWRSSKLWSEPWISKQHILLLLLLLLPSFPTGESWMLISSCCLS